MNDLSVASLFISRDSDSATSRLSLPLANLCSASAQADELLKSMPDLRHAMRGLLRTALRRVGVNDSPDMLFLNTRTMDGSLLSSTSLTEAMIQALLDGVAVLDGELLAVYTRHDSVDSQFLAGHIDLERLKQVFTQTTESLSDHFLHLMNEFWSQPMDSPGSPDHKIVPQVEWSSLQLTAMINEVELGLLKGDLDQQDKARLRSVLSNTRGEGAHSISLVADGQSAAPLNSTFVITRKPQASRTLTVENSEGPVFLLTAIHGVEKFDSLSVLDQTLRERFLDPQARAFLLDDLQLQLADQLSTATQIECEYRPNSGYLVHLMVRALRVKQAEDCRWLLAKASESKDVASLLKSVQGVQSLAWFDDARRHSFHSHVQYLQALTTPHWLKYSNEGDKASYELFEDEYRLRAATANQLLTGLESLEGYALSKIDDYLLQHLGYSVDPTQVFITLQDKWPSSTGELSATYRKSLLDYALNGLPITSDDAAAQISLPPGDEHPAFTFSFVNELIAQLDLRYQYFQALKARYLLPETQRAMLHQRDSALALSALAAQLQGHLHLVDGSDRAVELIALIRADGEKQGAVLQMGALEVGAEGNRLRDAIVFSDVTETDAHYVLYMPGAPVGRDMFVFDSWRKLYHEVAGWAATPNGRAFFVSQNAPDRRESITAFMQAVGGKAINWKEEDIRFIPMHGDYQSNLTELINAKIKHELAELPVVIAGERSAATYNRRRQLAVLDARIDFLNRTYASHMNLISYSEYARRAGEAEILKRLNQTIDPDTVFFDLYSLARRPQPDFGAYTDLISLTQLLMNDFKYHLDDRAPMYSSIGQNLSTLSMDIVQQILSEPAGEKYIDILKQDYGDRSNPDYLRRRGLFAQRKYFEVYRDLLITHLEGGFSQEQYQWALMLLSTVYPGATSNTPPPTSLLGNSSLNAFYLNGRLIEGVMVFKRQKAGAPDFSLLYTPEAPDGIRFRSPEEFISTLTSPGMDAYYYNRVSYKAQPSIGTLFQELSKNKERALQSLTFDDDEKIRDLPRLHDAMIRRMIQDVDEQSLSKAEAFAEALYNVVKWTGTILLIPFPPAAVAWGFLNTSITLARGYLAYLDGDRATAGEYYVLGVVGLALGALGTNDLALSTHGLGYKTMSWVAKKSVSRIA